MWRKKEFVQPDLTFKGDLPEQPADMQLATPLQYFQRFITDDMLDNVVSNTNLYTVQKTGKSIETSKKELERLFGMFFHMGLVKMSGICQYWEIGTSYEPVSGVMGRNRFQLLLTSIHLVDNLTVTDEDKKADMLWKVRPWINQLRENCLKITP